MTVKQPNNYLQFLQSVHVMTARKRLIAMEPMARELLNEVAVQHWSGTPMTVTRLMELDRIASPATLHRKMQMLLGEGLIELIVDDGNKRSKFVHLSKKGGRYFDSLSNLMAQASLQT